MASVVFQISVFYLFKYRLNELVYVCMWGCVYLFMHEYKCNTSNYWRTQITSSPNKLYLCGSKYQAGKPTINESLRITKY